MLVIGLTGGIGSGKSTVANLFQKKGITIIDTDRIARDITQPGQLAFDAIVSYFGPDILCLDGTLNRPALRSIIFSDDKKRLWLEELLHPLIRAEMKTQINTAASPYCIAAIPLLLETSRNPLIDRVLVVDTSQEEQIKRTEQRDHLSTQDVMAIIKSQTSREHRLAKANDIIYNYHSIRELEAQVNQLHNFYMSFL